MRRSRGGSCARAFPSRSSGLNPAQTFVASRAAKASAAPPLGPSLARRLRRMFGAADRRVRRRQRVAGGKRLLERLVELAIDVRAALAPLRLHGSFMLEPLRRASPAGCG